VIQSSQRPTSEHCCIEKQALSAWIFRGHFISRAQQHLHRKIILINICSFKILCLYL
jgi:hypothetical protein